MPRKFFKHKLLLDEGFPRRQKFPILNSRFDIKHITGDLNKVGLKDREVYMLGCKLKRLIVTFNEKDFKEFASKNSNTGIIGISANMPISAIDKKLTSLLMRSNQKNLCNKLTSISGEGLS